MKKLLPLILFIVLLISGCGEVGNISAIKNNNISKSPNKVKAEEKGFQNIEKIKIVKFTYDNQKTLLSQKVVKSIIIDRTEDLKKFMEAFNSKELLLKKFDMGPMPYKLTLITKDGSEDVYDLSFIETEIFLHQNGNGYSINNTTLAKEITTILKKAEL